jgi:hypothetical protein
VASAAAVLVALAMLCIYFPTVIAWCMWQKRAAHNLRAFSGRLYEFTPAWSIGCYFVPFVNLAIPFQAVREIYKASDPAVQFDEASWSRLYRATIVRWWWGLWLALTVLGILSTRLKAATQSEAIAISALQVLHALVGIVVALTAAAMIRRINRNQWRRSGLQAISGGGTLDMDRGVRLS